MITTSTSWVALVGYDLLSRIGPLLQVELTTALHLWATETGRVLEPGQVDEAVDGLLTRGYLLRTDSGALDVVDASRRPVFAHAGWDHWAIDDAPPAGVELDDLVQATAAANRSTIDA